MKNKKGAEMTITTIIIIILALVVLVVLIYGFSTGWANLWQKISVFGGGKTNVQTIVQGCQLACTTGSRYDYCVLERTVIFGEKEKDKYKERTYTCGELQKDTSIGLDCPAIKCDNPVNCEEMSDRNTLVIITEEVTGCPEGTNEVISTDTVAAAGEEKKAVCCQSQAS